MQIIIDLTDEQLEALTKLSGQKGLSRTALVREAVTKYLHIHRIGDLSESLGLWRGKAIDRIQYQKRLRGEWEGQTS